MRRNSSKLVRRHFNDLRFMVSLYNKRLNLYVTTTGLSLQRSSAAWCEVGAYGLTVTELKDYFIQEYNMKWLDKVSSRDLEVISTISKD